MPKINIETSQNVQLSFQLASLRERIIATIVDRVLILIYIIGAMYFMNEFAPKKQIDGYYWYIFTLALPLIFFNLILETLSNGQSLGKVLLKLQVLKLDGTSPTFFDFIIRWMFRFIDLYSILFVLWLINSELIETYFVLSLLPLVAMLSISFSTNNQRLGDLIAKTVVVKKTLDTSLNDTVLPYLKLKNYQPTFLNVLELNDRDVRIIKEVIESNNSNDDLINKLATKAKEILDISSTMPDRDLLLKLLKDYNYLAIVEDQNKI